MPTKISKSIIQSQSKYDTELFFRTVVGHTEWIIDGFSRHRLHAELQAQKITVLVEAGSENENETAQRRNSLKRKRSFCGLKSNSEKGLLPALVSLAHFLLPYEFNLIENRQIVLIGSRFSGKSTFLQRLVYIVCKCQRWQGNGSCLIPLHIDLVSLDVDLVIDIFEKGRDFQDQNRNRLPTPNDEMKFDDVNAEILSRYIVRKYSGDYDMLRFLIHEIKCRRYWLILDNFDRCSEAKQAQVLAWLQYVYHYSGDNPEPAAGVRCVIATSSFKYSLRIRSNLQPFITSKFAALHLRPLASNTGAMIVCESVAANLPLPSKKRLNSLIRNELARPEFSLFLKNPLMTRIFAEIVSQNLELQMTSVESKEYSMSKFEIMKSVIWKLVTFQIKFERANIEPSLVHQLFECSAVLIELLERLAYKMYVNEKASISISDIHEASMFCSTNKTERVRADDVSLALLNRDCIVLVSPEEDVIQEESNEGNSSMLVHSQPRASSHHSTQFQPAVSLSVIDIHSDNESEHNENAELPNQNQDRFVFVDQSVQEHLCAEYVAKQIQENVENFRPSEYHYDYVRERILLLVERFFLGHFQENCYRISSYKWLPVIITVFDILESRREDEMCDYLELRKCQQSNDIGEQMGEFSSLSDVFLDVLVSRCMPLHGWYIDRLPTCLERLWLAAVFAGNVYLVNGLIHRVGVERVLLAVDEDGNNALHLAAVNNRPLIIEILMSKNEVDNEYLDRNNKFGWDPSNMAMVYNHTRCFRLLCRTDGDKIASDDVPENRPEIVEAAMQGNLLKLKTIIKSLKKETESEWDEKNTGENNSENIPGNSNSDNINYNVQNGYSYEKRIPKHKLCKRNKIKGVKRSCEDVFKSKLNVQGSSGMTAAMWAARNGYVEILLELISNGADVIEERANGISTLVFAVESGNLECVEILLDAGARAVDRTPDNDSLLLCACSFGYDDIAIALIERGASALEALVVSCVQGKDSTVLSLVESGLVDINQVWDELMVSPLAGACVTGHFSTVKLLLSVGADPNVSIDVEYGSTPLMLAVHMGNIEVVQCMLDAGADATAVAPSESECARANGENMTAMEIARLHNHETIVQLLERHLGITATNRSNTNT